MNLLTIFQRAALNLNLTPGERAILKLLKGVLAAGVVAGLGVLAPLVTSGQFTFSPKVEQAVIGAVATAMFFALEKLFTAKADAPIAPQHQQSAPAPSSAVSDGSAI